MKYFIEEFLKAGRSIFKAKSESFELVKTPWGRHTSFILVRRSNRHKMKRSSEVNFAEVIRFLDVGTEDEIESRGDDIEDIESSTRMMVQETTNSEFKIYKKGKNLEKPYHQIFGTFFLF